MNKILLLAAAVCAALAPAAVSAQSSSPVRVAVIDSGVQPNGALKGMVEAEYDMVEGRKAFSTKDDHGTAVATVIERAAHRPVSIISLRVDKDGKCSEDRCEFDIAAVRAAVLKAVQLRVDVINMSLETPFDVQLYVMLKNAANSGIRIAMAAGNAGGTPKAIRYASMVGPNLWLVGANDQQGAHAAFSARPTPECAAQFVWRTGVDVPTQKRNGQATTMSGTSFAAPLYAAELVDGTAHAPVAIASR